MRPSISSAGILALVQLLIPVAPACLVVEHVSGSRLPLVLGLVRAAQGQRFEVGQEKFERGILLGLPVLPQSTVVD